MDSDRWEQLQTLFHDALARPEAERNAFVDNACDDDTDLAIELRRMLAADASPSPLLDHGLSHIAYQMVAASSDAISSPEFGPYRLKRVLGEGGMGVVWLAERVDAGNLVAIKFLPHASLSPARRERFACEVKILAKLNHPFIARLYDAGTLADGTPWFVMQYVDGLQVTDYCLAQDLEVDQRLRLFRSICEAVQYAHSQEIIHRDLKPSNILVEKDGAPRLLDFGIAKELHNLEDPADQTKAGLRFMSRHYAAPEWVHDGTVGFSTDVYSLGIILYEMLAGQPPFDRSKSTTVTLDPADRIAADEQIESPSHAARRTTRSSTSGGRLTAPRKGEWKDLDVLCLKAMHKDSKRRYPSVEALLRDVNRYLNREPLEARGDSFAYRLSKFVSRNRPTVFAGAAALLLVIGMIAYFTVRLAKERNVANREMSIATAMSNFLTDDLLARNDPFKSGKAKEFFVDVVTDASPRIDLQFGSEPVVAARLHQAIAKAFDNRSEFDHARKEYEQANNLFLKGEGAQSQDAVVTRLQRAAMEARSTQPGSLAVAKSLLHDAEVTVSQIKRPRPEVGVWLAATRGVIGIVSNDAHNANDNFAEAVRQAQAIPSFDGASLLKLKQMLAFSYTRLGQPQKAESLFRELIKDYSSTVGEDSPNVLKTRDYLAQTLILQHRYAEAIDELDIIYPALVEQLGETHEATLTALNTRAVAEGYLEKWDDAIRDDLTSHRLSVLKQGPLSFTSISSLSDAALSQCRAGIYQKGEANAREAFREAAQAFGSRAGLTGGCAYTLATCLIARNQLDEAAELLHNIDIKAVSQLAGDPGVGASVALLQGEIALRRGDYLLAQRYAQIAAPMFTGPDADPADQQSFQKLSKAIDEHGRAAN
jgi:serine/threonine protein kinase